MAVVRAVVSGLPWFLGSCVLAVVIIVVVETFAAKVYRLQQVAAAGAKMQRLAADARFDAIALEQLRERARAELPPDIFDGLTDEDLARFVVARSGSVDAALSQLKTACTWRKTVLASPPTCKVCEANPSAHSHVPIGVEASERSTIFYGCPARATDQRVDPTVQHVGLALEHAFALPSTGPRWVWCVDYHGFGLSHAAQGRLAARFATLFSGCMPERLHKIILLNPPLVFKARRPDPWPSGSAALGSPHAPRAKHQCVDSADHLVYASRLQVMLDAVRPFVDSVTLGKIVTLRGSNEVILAKLKDEHAFPPPTLLWMRATLETAPSQCLPPLPAGAAEQLLPGLRSVCPCEVSPEAEPGEIETANA